MDIGMILSIVVGILSVLAVVLIGWQIYTLIDFRKAVKTVKLLSDKVNYEISNVNLSTNMALTDFYYRFNTEDKQNIEFKYIQHGIMTIMHASSIKNIKVCNAMVDAMITVISKPKEIILTKYNKELIFSIISNIKNGNEIERYGELLQKLALIQVD